MVNTQRNPLPENQMGPAEKLLDVVLSSSAHLWHNRPGLDVNGKWLPARGNEKVTGAKVKPGLFLPAATELYSKLVDIYSLNPDLMAHFASYALVETEWRDLKVASAALMLVQEHSGQPVIDDDGTVAFFDDDYRAIGEAMVLHYKRKSSRMFTPKMVLRVAQLLEQPAIAELNRIAGFADPAGKKAAMGRWKKAATKWLAYRESNPALLQGLVKAGYKETIKNIARKVGYKPQSEQFFAVLGWKQSQTGEGHRALGLDGTLELNKRERFDGLSEAEICELVVTQRLSHKEVVGRLPQDIGLTPAIMVALLPTLSNRDLRQLTPTLEELGLMAEATIRERWEQAVAEATDQRALNIAKNVANKELRDKLEEASDNAAKAAVAEATRDVDVHVMFLIDRSGSMQGAIKQSKEALTRILAGIPAEKLHIATFDTFGTVLKPKASSRKAVEHMLKSVKIGGGTTYAAGVQALFREGVRIPRDAKLVVIAVGDEAGESGRSFAASFRNCGYDVAAMALIVNVAYSRGRTVQDAAVELKVPFSEVRVDQFDDPYQVPRVLKALLDAPHVPGAVSFGLVERVMKTPLLTASA